MSARNKRSFVISSMIIYGLNAAVILFLLAEAHSHNDVGIGVFFLSIFNAMILAVLKSINVIYRLFGGTPFTVMAGVREALALSALMAFLLCWPLCMR